MVIKHGFKNYYVSTLEDFKKIELLEDVPYKVIITKDIKANSYELDENIRIIEKLLEEYRNTRKQYVRTGKDKYKVKGKWIYSEITKIYKNIKKTYTLAPDIDFDNYFLMDEAKEKLEDLKEKFSYRFRPIDLKKRTKQLLIVGDDNKISNLEINSSNNTALFINVNCDITINDLEFSNIRVNGNNNVSLLINGRYGDNNITLSNVGIHGYVNGTTNVSELISCSNGTLVINGVEYRIVVNDFYEENRIVKYEKERLDGGYLHTRNFDVEDKEYIRERKKH